MTIEDLHKLWDKKNGGKSAASEHDLQVQCVRWFRYRFPNAIIYAVPNGGFRTSLTAKLMKMEGQLAGVPDLHIPIAKGGYHSLYIEMKNGKAGRVSDYQKEMIEKLRNYGHKVEVVRSFNEFVEVVSRYME